MERSRKLSAVVFDLGEVLATPGDGLYEQLAAATNAPMEAVKHAYWAERDGYDRGSALEDYWGGFARTLGHVDPDADLLRRLSDIDSTSWVAIRDDARDVLRELNAHGVPTAILSNAPVALGVLARESDWAQWVTGGSSPAIWAWRSPTSKSTRSSRSAWACRRQRSSSSMTAS